MCNWKYFCVLELLVGVGGNQIQFGSLNSNTYLWKGFFSFFKRLHLFSFASFFNNLLFRLMFNLVCKQSTEKRDPCIFHLIVNEEKSKIMKTANVSIYFSYFAFGCLYKKNRKRHKNNNNLICWSEFLFFWGSVSGFCFFLCFLCLFVYGVSITHLFNPKSSLN